MRYTVTAPVSNGYEYWNVNDEKLDRPLVTIFKDVPNAEYYANKIAEGLRNAEEKES